MSDTDATQARQDVVADVDEILEHVINANMLSMPYDVYSELFDAVAGLGVKVEKLQAENAKLRGLVSTMAYCMQYERECDGCRLNGADGAVTEPAGCDGLLDRMRELGVSE